MNPPQNIIMPIRRPWTDLMFAGGKPFEFRNNPGKHWAPGSVIYVYESKANGGAGKVIGSVTIAEIIRFPKKFIGPPRPLLRYWAENVRCDSELCRLLDILGDYELPGYYQGTVLRYLSSGEEILREVMAQGKWVPLDSSTDADSKADPQCQCEDWLTRIGLISPYGKYAYTHAIQLTDIHRYATPQALSEFGLARAPQSWAYCPLEAPK